MQHETLYDFVLITSENKNRYIDSSICIYSFSICKFAVLTDMEHIQCNNNPLGYNPSKIRARQPTALLVSSFPLTEVKIVQSVLERHVVSMPSPPGIASFLDQNHRYKTVSIHITNNVG